jgi:hypothetical protein
LAYWGGFWRDERRLYRVGAAGLRFAARVQMDPEHQFSAFLGVLETATRNSAAIAA